MSGGSTMYDMREAKKVKCFRFARVTLLSVMNGPRTKLQESRLLGMKLKTELEHALFQFCQKLLGLRFMFKTHNKVIGPSYDDHLTARFVSLPLLCPEIQDVMKIDIRKQGTNRTPLRNTFVRRRPQAILHDSRFEPFLDQTGHALISDSMFDKLDQPIMIEVVEKASDVSIQDPVHFPCQQTDVERIEAVVLPFTRSVSVGKSEEVSLVDRVHHFNRGSLDDLVLQHRNTQRALLAIGFGDEYSSY